jgi:hypothetical protein
MVAGCICSIAETRRYGVWVSAFAGTTRQVLSALRLKSRSGFNRLFSVLINLLATNPA